MTPDDLERALALTAPEGPLHGLEVQFQHHAYDWNDTAPLTRVVADLARISRTGGLSADGRRVLPCCGGDWLSRVLPEGWQCAQGESA